MTAPDKQTIVLKLSEPNVTLYSLLGHSGLGYFYIMPKEAANTASTTRRTRRMGERAVLPDEVQRHELNFKRNPNFKRAALKDNEPYIEEIYEPIITDNSQVAGADAHRRASTRPTSRRTRCFSSRQTRRTC